MISQVIKGMNQIIKNSLLLSGKFYWLKAGLVETVFRGEKEISKNLDSREFPQQKNCSQDSTNFAILFFSRI